MVTTFIIFDVHYYFKNKFKLLLFNIFMFFLSSVNDNYLIDNGTFIHVRFELKQLVVTRALYNGT